jgi:hypothetical protein
VLVCQEDLYEQVAHESLPSTAVKHTITTSPLELLDPAKPLPPMLAGMPRFRHAATADLWHSSPATSTRHAATR